MRYLCLAADNVNVDVDDKEFHHVDAVDQKNGVLHGNNIDVSRFNCDSHIQSKKTDHHSLHDALRLVASETQEVNYILPCTKHTHMIV